MVMIATLTDIPKPIPEFIIRGLTILIILTNHYAYASTTSKKSATFFTRIGESDD